MTKKEAILALFAEGKSPSSPEVQAIGLKSPTRATYYWEWKKGGGKVTGSLSEGTGSVAKQRSGETIGGIDETKQMKKEAKSPDTEAKSGEESESTEANPANPENQQEPTEAEEEKPKPQESIGGASEVRGKAEDDKSETKPPAKAGLTIAEEGIRCVVFLSLPTLTLYEIAAARQTQLAGNGVTKLLLGDFIDTCVNTFFKDRKLELGLIKTGGK